MPRTPSRPALRVDALESRLALSTAAVAVDTTLTPGEYATARVQIDVAVARLALTGSESRAETSLAQATRRVPDGTQLLPTLRTELAAADVSSFRSIQATRQKLLNSLDAFIRDGVAAGEFSVNGRALQNRFPTAAQASGSYYFPVTNRTGQVVNFTLTQTNNPTSPQTTTIYTTGTPANVSFGANPTPPLVLATVTPQSGTKVLGQAVVPRIVNSVQLVNNNSGGVSILFS